MAAEGSDILRQLALQNHVHIDYLQVGPWLGVTRMLECVANFPVLLHCNTSLIDPNFDPNTLIELAHQTNSPSLSLHLSLPDTWLYKLWLRAGIPIPFIRQTIAFQRAIENLACLQSKLNIPILIENQAHHRRSGHDYLANPLFISQIVETTNVNLLLDLGHARVSATMRGETPERYVEQLPLHQVSEIHINGPGIYRNRLRDLHQPLSPVDYVLLQFILPRCPNLQFVTLEFFGPAEPLITQLSNLRAILDAYSASPITRTS